MARKSVTEADMGLEPTPEEMAAAAPPPDDDISLADDAPATPNAAASDKEGDAPETPPAGGADEPKLVDVRALQEARAEAREAKRNAQVLEQRWNDFIALQQRQNQPEPAPEQPPAPGDDDPYGQLKWLKQQFDAQKEAEAERERQTAQQRAEAEQSDRMVQWAQREFADTAKDDPSLPEAYEALKASIASELQAFGLTQQQVAQQFDRTERQYIAYAAANRIPIGQYVKALAQARGWRPGAGGDKAPAATAAQQPRDPADMAAAQQRHMSLSDAPGGEQPAKLDAKAIAKMSDKQFAAFMRQQGAEDRLDEILGA